MLIDNIPSPTASTTPATCTSARTATSTSASATAAATTRATAAAARTNDAARDLNVLLGKILRITPRRRHPARQPVPGSRQRAAATSPAAPTPGKKCQETYAWGLRNPFRFAFDPNATGHPLLHQRRRPDTLGGDRPRRRPAPTTAGTCARATARRTRRPTAARRPPGMTNPIYDYTALERLHRDHRRRRSCPNGVWPAAVRQRLPLRRLRLRQDLPAHARSAAAASRATDFVTGLGRTSITSMIVRARTGPTQALYYMNCPERRRGPPHRLHGHGQPRADGRRRARTRRPGPLPLDGRASTAAAAATPTATRSPTTGTSATAARMRPSAAPSATPTRPPAPTPRRCACSDGRGGAGHRDRPDRRRQHPARADDRRRPPRAKRFRVGEKITLTRQRDRRAGRHAARQRAELDGGQAPRHAHASVPAAPPPATTCRSRVPTPRTLLATTTTYLEIRLTATDSQGLSTTITRRSAARTWST